MTWPPPPIGDQPLNLWLQRQRATAESDRALARIARETNQNVPDHPNAHLIDSSKAGGIPLQIVVAGRPIVSMQRADWKPDRIAD